MRKAFQWIGFIAAILFATLVVANLGLYALGEARLKKTYTIPEEVPSFPRDAASLAEGRRIFQYRGCEACHGEQLQGLVYLDNPAIGQVITPNLTNGAGGIGSQRSDAELARAIRHGVRPDGTPLLFMPSTEFYYLNDEDLGKVLAYIRSAPPVENEMPASRLSFTGRVVMSIAREITFLPAELIPHNAPRPIAPQPGITTEYGEYLALSCKVCHGLTLSGGNISGFPPEWPSAPNLTTGQGGRLPDWKEEGFIELIRTGKKHGRFLSTAYMPWQSYQFMTDEELRAVYFYLISLPPKAFGNH